MGLRMCERYPYVAEFGGLTGGLDLIFNDGGMWCSEPFVYLILCPKELCIWVLEIRPVNYEHGCPHLGFR